MPAKLSAIVLTKNEARHITACLESLAWADERIVFDSGSEDETVALAQAAGASVHIHPFENYAQQRNAALTVGAGDWVLFVDADERVTPALAQEIQAVLQAPRADGYWIPRHNFIFGRVTLYAGWYPDYQLRLLRRGAAHYDQTRPVHEVVILAQGEGEKLCEPFIHYNYDTLAQFHAKQRRYSAYDAQMLYQAGVRPKIYTPHTQAIRHFKWRFWDLGGYRGGLHGLLLCLLMAYYERRKYQLLAGLWRASARPESR
jgi:glycosyltransferase involved in cell wall biosynthesis